MRIPLAAVVPALLAAGLAGEKYYEYDCGFGATRARPTPIRRGSGPARS